MLSRQHFDIPSYRAESGGVRRLRGRTGSGCFAAVLSPHGSHRKNVDLDHLCRFCFIAHRLLQIIGGSPLNFACGLAQLGYPVSMVTAVGDDALGAQGETFVPPQCLLKAKFATACSNAAGIFALETVNGEAIEFLNSMGVGTTLVNKVRRADMTA